MAEASARAPRGRFEAQRFGLSLRFDQLELRLCLREFGDEGVVKIGMARHSLQILRSMLSLDGEELYVASAKDLPEPARRHDLERADRCEAQ